MYGGQTYAVIEYGGILTRDNPNIQFIAKGLNGDTDIIVGKRGQLPVGTKANIATGRRITR